MLGDAQISVSITTFYQYLIPIPYTYEWRQLSWMSCDHKICVCYFRLFNFVICYNYEKFGFYKARQFWPKKCIIKSCCFFANHFSSTKMFPESCLYMWQTMSFESFVDQLQIIKSMFCSIFLIRKAEVTHTISFSDGLSICCLGLDILC